MTSIPNRTIGRLVLAGLSLFSLGLLQAIEATLSASGLLFLDLALDVPHIGHQAMAAAMALAVQSAQLCGELLLIDVGGLRRRASLHTLLAVALLMPLAICFTGFLHFVQMTNRAHGAALVAGQMQDAAAVWTRLSTADARITTAYKAALADTAARAADALAGRDPSGKAACGPICMGARQTNWRLRTEFAALANPVLPSSWTAVNAPAALAALHANVDALRPRAAAFQAMCQSLGRACADPLTPILADPGLARLESALGGGEATGRADLVMRQTGAELRGLTRGEISPLTALLLAIVLLLPLAEMLVLLTLRVALAPPTAAERLATMRDEDETLDEELRLHASLSAKHAFRDTVLAPAE